MHETGRKVATSGIGESVKITSACGRYLRINLYIALMLSTFSATDDTRNLWRVGSYLSVGTALQKTLPVISSYQISDSQSVMMNTSALSKLALFLIRICSG